MAKKSTGVYVVDKYDNPYELTEYNLFVQQECAKLKKKGIHIPGSGNTLVYIGELWQKKKANEAAKTEREQKAILNVDKKIVVPKIHASSNIDVISTALRNMGEPEWIQWETIEKREKRYNDLIMSRANVEQAAKEPKIQQETIIYASNNDIISTKLRNMGEPEWKQWETPQQREKRYNDLILSRANAEHAARELKKMNEEIERKRCYKIIEHSNTIISTFNITISNTPESRPFKGVQV